MTKGYKTGGRLKGTPNKFTVDLRQMILRALSEVGGHEYLMRQAEQNPTAFLALVGKVVPKQLSPEEIRPVERPRMSDLEVARRLAFLLARGAQALKREQAQPGVPRLVNPIRAVEITAVEEKSHA